MRSTLCLLPFALPLVLASHQPNVNHRELAKRAKGDLLDKRDQFDGARWTFYSTGLGACGGTNSDSDFIVALNQDTFGYSYPSQYCYKKITMTYNGKTTTATIVDSCPGCPSSGGLDLSPGLFSFFADQSEGVIYGDWSFADDSGSGGDDTTTSTTEKKTTTTTHTTPKTTSTTHTTTHTTTKATPSSSSVSKSASSSAPASSSAAKSSSAAPAPSTSATVEGAIGTNSQSSTENLEEFSQAFIALTNLVIAGTEDQ
ncbi:RlpA-like double-psi beta-barrel-protein domain-containing protein-containing protein [Mycena galopus ATCC 62051]|jgi:hypothetical protein|nr:RlpA-like double-psi beta-barrel-protein domain-containing protein-containing protein [Mycena galopus ATCC 62051]